MRTHDHDGMSGLVNQGMGYASQKKTGKAGSADTKNFRKLGVPMHPGAEAYYKKKGLWQE